MTAKHFVSTFAIAVSVMLGSCTEDYPPFARLESLRVLAIKSEPVAPAAGETTTLTPLVFAPAGLAIAYAWSWCPFVGAANDGYPCLLPEAQLAALLGPAAAGVPPYNLGEGPTASFVLGFDPALLSPLCTKDTLPMGSPDAGAELDAGAPADAGQAPPAFIDCKNGFPIQVRLKVKTANDEVETVRTLNLRLDPGVPPNQNPQLLGLAATFETPDPNDDETFDVAFDEVGTVQLPRQKPTEIKALITPDQSEPYIDEDDLGRPLASKERLFLTWFVESGKTSPERTSFIDGAVVFNDFAKTEWTPGSSKDYPATVSRLFVVVRDNRGGVNWATGVASLVGPQ